MKHVLTFLLVTMMTCAANANDLGSPKAQDASSPSAPIPAPAPLTLDPVYAAAGADSDEWHFSLWVYAWIASFDGEVGGDTGSTGEIDVDLPLSDAFDLDGWGFMGHIEAQHGKWSIFADGLYLDLEADRQTQFDGQANAELQASILELGASYSVIHKPVGDGPGRHFRADVLGGARLQSIEIDVDRTFTGGGSISADGREDWIDPFVGARAMYDITDSLYVFARGDIGGFGVGSDLVWNANVGVGYDFADWFGIAAGYRWLDYDYDDNDFKLDLLISGPWVAVVFRF